MTASTSVQFSCNSRQRLSSIVPCWKTFLPFARKLSLSPSRSVTRLGTPTKRTPFFASTRPRFACPRPTSKLLQTCSLPALPTPACASKITPRSKSPLGGNASTLGSAKAPMCTPISSTRTLARLPRMPSSFSESRADRRSSIAFVEIAEYSGRASSGFAVGSVPGFAVDWLDGFHIFLGKRFVNRRKLFCNVSLEFAGHVIKLFLQRIDARGLIVGWAAFIVQDGSVELRRFLADALFAGDGASFRRCHDLLSHAFHFPAQFLYPLP